MVAKKGQHAALQGNEVPDRRELADERKCSLTILRLLQAREQETLREVTRARVSQATLRRLCGRSQIPPEFLVGIQEYLLGAGWALFCVSASYYALIQVSKVEGWGRISSKRIAHELHDIARGKYDFAPLEPLLLATQQNEEEPDDGPAE